MLQKIIVCIARKKMVWLCRSAKMTLLVQKLVTIVVSLYFIALFLELSKDVDEKPRLSNIYPVQEKKDKGNYVGHLIYDWQPKTFSYWKNALEFVPPKPLQNSNTKRELRRFEELMQQQSVVCPDLRNVGGCYKRRHMNWGFEGFYEVCFSKEVEMKRDSCIVYCFGINYDFTFDEGMARYGCDVFSFDPSMNTPDHDHNKKIKFYRTGLSNEDREGDYEANKEGSKENWKMKQFASVLKDLGHENKIIDVLKIDIEEDEWIALPNMLADGSLQSHVKQLIMELHLVKETPTDMLRYYGIAKWLERQGFELIKQKVPHICMRCFEVTYVNTYLVKLPKIKRN